MSALRPPGHLRAEYADWSWTTVSSHPSRFETYRLERGRRGPRYLKVAAAGSYPSLVAEAQRTRWARGWLPAPEVLEFGADGGVEWLVTQGLEGTDATQHPWTLEPERAVRALARGLRIVHEVPARACPYDFRLDAALAHAARRVQEGRVDPHRDFHDEFAHLSALEALRLLIEDRPTETDLVVCHGDYCAPNILLSDWEPVGFVDLGELGVADRWWDLAVATWSVGWNYGSRWERTFLDEYGAAPDDAREEYYRLLYDVVS